jgi:hypothetical protein
MGSSLYHLFVGLPGGEYLKELKATVGHYCINATFDYRKKPP